jgi:hypothetical protein
MSKQASTIRVVAYVRVSDPSQVEKHSLAAQKVDIEHWCSRRGYKLVRVYCEEGKSAYTERRPVLMTLFQDAKAGEFDIVVVNTIDRWSRNVGVQRQSLQMLGDAKVGFASVTEDFDFTTPHGKMMLTTMGTIAEFFSGQLGVHVAKSQRYRASIGLPVGPIPFAYRTLEPGGVPHLEPAKPAAVLQVFMGNTSGDSMGTSADWLNAQGFKTRTGGIFTPHAVRDMLNCRFYVGKISYNGHEYQGQHEAFISEELFEKVQSRRKRRPIVRTVHGAKGLLQGMISCGSCGNGIQSDRHRYGGAMYRERHSHECTTNGRSLMALKVDHQVQVILTSLELRPEWREEMARLAMAGQEGPDPKVLRERKRRVSHAYIAGGISEAEYKTKIAEIDASLQLTENVELPTLEEAAQLVENIPQLWEEATPEESRKKEGSY